MGPCSQIGLSCEVVILLMLNACGVIQYRYLRDWVVVVLRAGRSCMFRETVSYRRFIMCIPPYVYVWKVLWGVKWQNRYVSF